MFMPGQGPMYAHQDKFGQVAWSRLPPTGGAFKRQPFYHEPMVCEEAEPQTPPTPPPGIIRSMSFADRQVSFATYSLLMRVSWGTIQSKLASKELFADHSG